MTLQSKAMARTRATADVGYLKWDLVFAGAFGAEELVGLGGVGRGEALGAVLVAGVDEAEEERMRLQGLGFELGMELAAEEVGVVGQLDDFDVGSVG